MLNYTVIGNSRFHETVQNFQIWKKIQNFVQPGLNWLGAPGKEVYDVFYKFE